MRYHRFLDPVIVTILVACVAVLTLGACGDSGSAGSSEPPADVEFIAPQDFAVADYAGKALVVNYFGSWCGPCNAEAPDLAAFAEGHPEAAIVGIAVDDEQDAVVDFMGEYGLTYPVVLDDGSLGANDGITGVPTTIFYDAAGKEVDRIVGAATTAQFDLSYAKAQ